MRENPPYISALRVVYSGFAFLLVTNVCSIFFLSCQLLHHIFYIKQGLGLFGVRKFRKSREKER